MAASEATELVCYAIDPETGDPVVVGVKEFQLAQVLLEGRLELLSQEVPSQWGPVHLFDFCLWFGLQDTAWAMAQRGVAGCVLQDRHLQGLLWDGQERQQDLPPGPVSWFRVVRNCHCRSEETCDHCSFGFPTADGVLMDDWDAKLDVATAEAHRVADRCLLQGLLKAVGCGDALLCAVSEKIKARLLDLAILTGNKEAASCLARVCRLRPLRRWRAQDLFGLFDGLIVLENPDVLLAALSAGINFTELWWHGGYGELPFREAVALSGRWSDFAELLPPPPRPWRPPPVNDLGYNLISEVNGREGLCTSRLRDAMEAGVALKEFQCDGSLLDEAICYGQADCAALCVAAGVEIWEVEKEHLQEDGPDASAQERQAAAEAAAREAMAVNFRRARCEKGVAVFQLMKTCMDGRPFPVDFVDELLLYSTEVPYIVKKLDLWDAAKAWHDSILILTKPRALQTVPSDIVMDGLKTDAKDAAEATADDASHGPSRPPAASASHESEAADADGSKASEEAAPDDLLRAIQESRAEAPPLWSRDGVRLYRLTRSVKAKHVVELLFDENGPLKELHDRVRDSGCAVDPENNPVKILFVPCTQEQIVELQQLADDHGLELSRWEHVLALQKDEALIDAALRGFARAHRPELRPVAWPQSALQSAAEEPMIVAELGFQTDSSVGYPTYQG